MAYRVPRRFIIPPEEPPPYGLFVLSFVGHAFFLLMAAAISTYVSQANQSKVYIVNLVPATPSPGTPTPRPVARPEPRPEPRPAPRPPTPEREPPPVKRVARPEPPAPPREIPRPERAEPLKPPRPDELVLPRRIEKQPPRLPPQPAREQLERTLPAPPQVSPPPPRLPELPRVAAPPQLPAVTAPPVVVARPGPDPMPLGRPDVGPKTTGSISLDVSDFPFTYYLRQIQAKIGERWSPPRAAVVGGERAVVLFEIDRDGQIKPPAVERSSGNQIYDQAALRAVLEASPFPPLPPEFRAPSLRVHFGFEFRPDQG